MNASVTLAGQGDRQEFDWGVIEWFASGPMGNSRTMTFGKVMIKSGSENPRHGHPNCEEILHLLSGKIEHTVGDESVVMNPGDTISIPIDVVHNAKSIGEEDAVMIISFSSADRKAEGE